jgi:NAD(P)-dependent dehydrogenase (short-subunit alcohol dehydrogenase family)
VNSQGKYSLRLSGRRVIVTGAGSGIGKATAIRCAGEGAQVALVDVNAAGLAETADACGGVIMVADLLDVGGLEGMVEGAASALGGLDGIVNCAGLAGAVPIVDLTPEFWTRMLAVNLTAPYLICRAALKWLNQRPGAAIVNIASGQALLPSTKGGCAYSASKGGLVAFTKALAAELAPGVRVNAICPGLVETPMVQHALKAQAGLQENSLIAQYAMKRAAQPDELASAIAFLLSDEASFITGATLPVDGGRTYH